jgi:hypothetical protein
VRRVAKKEEGWLKRETSGKLGDVRLGRKMGESEIGG